MTPTGYLARKSHKPSPATAAITTPADMSTTYPDPNAQMSGAPSAYTTHNESAPSQQQQEHMTDPELRLQANLQQLRDGGDMMHSGAQPQSQYHQLAQMPPNMTAHPHFQSTARPTHSPQQMAHAVMSLEGQHDTFDPNDPSRKRSKVSRACDECRRKKVCRQYDTPRATLIWDRFDAMQRARMARRRAPVVRELELGASSADSL